MAERRSYPGAAPDTTLSSLINSTTLSIPVTTGTGYPSGTTGPFFICIDRGGINEEKIKCVSTNANTISAVSGGRGADGTVAVTHQSGESVEAIITADDLNILNSHAADTSGDDHVSLLNSTRHGDSTLHTFGAALATPGTPSTSSVADTASSGTNAAASRSDHRHARESFGSPVGVGASNSQGSATTTSRSDHVHANLSPSVRVYGTIGGPLNSGIIYPINFNSERYKTDAGMHSTTTNTGRLVATVAGKYHIFAHVDISSNPTGTRWAYIQRNGTQTIASETRPAVPTAGYGNSISISTIWAMSAGDYVTLNLLQDSGSTLSLTVEPAFSPEFGMAWMGY